MTDGRANEGTTQPEFVRDLSALAAETREVGQFLRLKIEPLFVQLAAGEILRATNRFGRTEYRLSVFETDSAGNVHVEPGSQRSIQKIVALPKRAMKALAELCIASKISELKIGMRIRIARMGSGFDTGYSVEFVDPRTSARDAKHVAEIAAPRSMAEVIVRDVVASDPRLQVTSDAIGTHVAQSPSLGAKGVRDSDDSGVRGRRPAKRSRKA